MFWIHGGSFIAGSANEYPPQYLMDKDVCYVSTNYRLGVLGTPYYKTYIIKFNVTCSKDSFQITSHFFSRHTFLLFSPQLLKNLLFVVHVVKYTKFL